MKTAQEKQDSDQPSPALTPPACSARFRAVVYCVGGGGTVLYVIHQKQWWGWSQISNSLLTKSEADKAIEELTVMQNAPVSDSANVNKS